MIGLSILWLAHSSIAGAQEPLVAEAQTATPANAPAKPFRVEFEAMRQLQISAGTARTQTMTDWEDDNNLWGNSEQLFWQDQKIGDTLTLEFLAPAAGTYNFKLFGTKASDYGIVSVTFNENQTDAREIDTYNKQVVAARLDAGEVTLRAGTNTVKIEVVGQNPKSNSPLVGLDFLDFVPFSPVRQGEISPSGTAQRVSEDALQIQLLAKNFTLPSGKSKAIFPEKIKTIAFTYATLIHFEGQTQNLKLKEVSLVGRTLTVIGADSGSGEPLSAREIIVSN